MGKHGCKFCSSLLLKFQVNGPNMPHAVGVICIQPLIENGNHHQYVFL